MASLKTVEEQIKASMKLGDKVRTSTLRMLVNETKKIAKSDGNREPTDDDLITAGNRLIKQTRETLSFLKEGDEQVGILNGEIALYESFLPKKMDRTELSGLIETLIASPDAPEGKAAKGFIMKNLNQSHRGHFDAAMANEIITEKVG